VRPFLRVIFVGGATERGRSLPRSAPARKGQRRRTAALALIEKGESNWGTNEMNETNAKIENDSSSIEGSASDRTLMSVHISAAISGDELEEKGNLGPL
jgi:hypothetical protein